MPFHNRRAGAALATAALLAGGAAVASPDEFNVTNLVSDGFVPAATIDPGLINPWGVAASPTGPFWISDNGSGLSTLYDGAGAKQALTVTIPPPAGSAATGSPTGQVFNGSTTDFMVNNGGKSSAAVFIFDSEDGTISGWSPSLSFTSAFVAVNNSDGGKGAVYKGLASGSVAGADFLYAANFRGGDVEIYDSAFKPVKTFTDPTVAAGYAPFNVQNLGGTLYVSFALQDGAKHDDVAGAGNGYVDAFDLSGNFLRRVVSKGGAIDSPWGLDIAPTGFGAFGGDLLVGNFGDGTISAFDATSGVFEGKLKGAGGAPLVLGDLWALVNGNGGKGGAADTVYFTAGLQDEAHGLLGALTPVPEPATWAFMLLGAGMIGAGLRARSRAMGWAARA